MLDHKTLLDYPATAGSTSKNCIKYQHEEKLNSMNSHDDIRMVGKN